MYVLMIIKLLKSCGLIILENPIAQSLCKPNHQDTARNFAGLTIDRHQTFKLAHI